MAGGAAVHFVPLRVAQIMQHIFRQAGSKNGCSAWVSPGDSQAAALVQSLLWSVRGSSVSACQ